VVNKTGCVPRFSLPMMKQTVDAIVEAGLRDQVKIKIGGAPVTQVFSDEIGAD